MEQMIEMRSILEEVTNKEVIAAQTTLVSLKTTWYSLLVEVAEVYLEINRSNKIHKSLLVESNTTTRFHPTVETTALTSKVIEDTMTSSKTRDLLPLRTPLLINTPQQC